MSAYGVCTPAYGRDYTSAAKAKAGFLSGVDWILNNQMTTTPCSVRDFKPGQRVQIRYKFNRYSGGWERTTVVEVPSE
jgi:hypothetical protein